MADSRVPPQALDAEEYVLGAAMLSPRAIEAAADVLRPGDFYRHSHQTVWDTILALHAENIAVDAITLADRLDRDGLLAEVGGRDRIRELATLVPAAGAAGHHAGVIRRAAIRRGLVTVGSQVEALGWTGDRPEPELLDEAERLVYGLAKTRSRTELAPVGEGLDETWAEIERVAESGKIAGLSTGMRDMDAKLAGLHPGNLAIIAGRPSQGKTGWLLTVIAHVTMRLGLPVALFTLEMDRQEIHHRLLCMEAHVDLQALRTGNIGREEWVRLASAASKLETAPLYIEDSRLVTDTDIRGKARRLASRHPLALIGVDYLQLITSQSRTENRNLELSAISRSLKVLAGELHVPVLAASQLSREVEKRHDKRPMMSDLRDSGALEQDADVIVGLYRDAYYHPEDSADLGTDGIAECIVLKQRNGPTGTVTVAFADRWAAFGDLAHGTPVARSWTDDR